MYLKEIFTLVQPQTSHSAWITIRCKSILIYQNNSNTEKKNFYQLVLPTFQFDVSSWLSTGLHSPFLGSWFGTSMWN